MNRKETNQERWFGDAYTLCGIEVREIGIQNKQYKQVIYEGDLVAQIPLESYGSWLDEAATCSVMHPQILT